MSEERDDYHLFLNSPQRKAAAAGLAIVVAYLVIAALTFRNGIYPVRPFFDGLAPPPSYRWVDPPPDFVATNEPPLGGGREIEMTETGSVADSVATEDGQAIITFPREAIPPRSGETSVTVTITPMDPDDVASDSGSFVVTGNAYRFEARYSSSGDEASLTREITVSLRYPTFAHAVLRLDGDEWGALPTNVASGIFAVYAESDRLGVFAAGDPETTRDYGIYIVVAAGILAAAALALVARRRRQS